MRFMPLLSAKAFSVGALISSIIELYHRILTFIGIVSIMLVLPDFMFFNTKNIFAFITIKMAEFHWFLYYYGVIK